MSTTVFGPSPSESEFGAELHADPRLEPEPELVVESKLSVSDLPKVAIPLTFRTDRTAQDAPTEAKKRNNALSKVEAYAILAESVRRRDRHPGYPRTSGRQEARKIMRDRSNQFAGSPLRSSGVFRTRVSERRRSQRVRPTQPDPKVLNFMAIMESC